jgi:hypothetical protein
MVWTRREYSVLTGARLRWVIVFLAGVLLITATAPRCSAQTWGEIFNQKKTQKKYLLNQIAALQVYLGYARKGYDVVSSGLDAVRDISSGEFNLHSAFISGLKKVSPAVRNDTRVAEIIAMQLSILKGFARIKGGDLLSPDQVIYVAEVANGVIAECYQDLSELLLVVSSGKLELNDQQRLERLGGIHERMADKSAFAQSFSGEVSLLIRQKSIEQQSLEKLRRYYGTE